MSEGSDAGPAEVEDTAAEEAPETTPEGPSPAAQEAPSSVPGPSSLGIWAFTLAMLGLVPVLPVIGSVLGFVLGRVAIRQADSRRLRGGRGLAVAAVAISVITLVVVALGVAAYALTVAYLDI